MWPAKSSVTHLQGEVVLLKFMLVVLSSLCADAVTCESSDIAEQNKRFVHVLSFFSCIICVI